MLGKIITIKCPVCKRDFRKRTKRKRGAFMLNQSWVRPMNAKTCSMKCSNVYRGDKKVFKDEYNKINKTY